MPAVQAPHMAAQATAAPAMAVRVTAALDRVTGLPVTGVRAIPAPAAMAVRGMTDPLAMVIARRDTAIRRDMTGPPAMVRRDMATLPDMTAPLATAIHPVPGTAIARVMGAVPARAMTVPGMAIPQALDMTVLAPVILQATIALALAIHPVPGTIGRVRAITVRRRQMAGVRLRM